jgi:serine phosphatase RsbU (regulator of sigma subunit)
VPNASERRTDPLVRRSYRPSPLTILVVVLGLLITSALAFLAVTVNDRNDTRLLNLQVREAATALAGYLPSIETPLISGAAVAEATGDSAPQFDQFMSSYVGLGRSFAYVALCKVEGGTASLLTSVGQPGSPSVPAHAGPCTSVSSVPGGQSLAITGFVPGDRLGYTYAPGTSDAGYVVYAESLLPPHRRIVIPKSFAFSDLNFALYLGHSEESGALIESTVAVPIQGTRAAATVPFSNTTLTLVGTPTQPLGGTLSRDLALIVAIGGVLLTLGAALLTERLIRRRRSAEGLAADNRRLYGEQKSLASSLQRALLPADLPHIDGIEFDTRYMAGTPDMDIGGDWFDLIQRSPGEFVFVVGDVSGRGDQAAIVMASLQYAIRAHAAEGDSPSTILTKLCHLLQTEDDGHFATVLVGSVDVANRRVMLANAGHFPPLLMSPDGSSFIPMPVGVPIGVSSHAVYDTTTFEIPTGATVVAFTDGLIERRGEIIDEGLDRLRNAAHGSSESVADLLTTLVQKLLPQGSNDDAALLAFRWQESLAAVAPGSPST